MQYGAYENVLGVQTACRPTILIQPLNLRVGMYTCCLLLNDHNYSFKSFRYNLYHLTYFYKEDEDFDGKMLIFFDIFKVVVVVIDGSDYLHQDNIPQLSHFSYLLMDSASSIQTPLLLLQLLMENLLCLILLKCYSPFLSKSLAQCMINGMTNYRLYNKKCLPL